MTAFRLLAGLAILAGTAAAQINFQLRVVLPDQAPATIPNNATVAVNAERVGEPVNFTFNAVYRGAVSVTINQPELFGSGDFTLISPPSFPLTLTAGQGLTLAVRYTPTSSARAITQLSFVASEFDPNFPQISPRVGAVAATFAGGAPELTAAYALLADGNVFPIVSGARILFPPTPINTTASAQLIVTNRGSAPGKITALSGGGGAFQLQGIPLLPTDINSNDVIRVNIRYQPRAIETSTATVTLVLGTQTILIGLEGSSTGPELAYELIGPDFTRPIQPNDPITFPDTRLGDRERLSLRVRNNGNGDAPIAGLFILGNGFSVVDSPFFPATIAPGTSIFLTVEFAPPTTGRIQARMRIGETVFELLGNGIGVRLQFRYSAPGGSPVTIGNNGVVVFTPVQVGNASVAEFTVRNNGTLAYTISSVDIISNSGLGPGGVAPFRLVDPPSLPAVLEAEAEITFSIRFAPFVAGANSATLRLDASNFSLSSSAVAPPPLPAYAFTPNSGVQPPQGQPTISLTLQESYPFLILGTLNILVVSEGFAVDPAVQWASGGRTVTFRIPPGTTRAVFIDGATETRLQTGTVAGTIQIVPAFQLQTGFVLTPDSAPTLNMQVGVVAPRLLNMQVISRSQTGFVLAISGYSTGRRLSQIELTFQTNPGFNVPQTKFAFDVEASAQFWFGSGASSAFGGLFTAQIPFNLTSDQPIPTTRDVNELLAARNLILALKSVSATASSAAGGSNTVSADLQ